MSNHRHLAPHRFKRILLCLPIVCHLYSSVIPFLLEPLETDPKTA